MGRVRFGFIKVCSAVPEVSVADCQANTQRIISLLKDATTQGVSIVALPELAITGSSCGHLFRQTRLLEAAERSICDIAAQNLPLAAIIGLPISQNGRLYNCAAVVAAGEICGIVPCRTASGVFDAYEQVESIYINFANQSVPFGDNLIFEVGGVKFGVEVGEDIRQIATPSITMAEEGAQIVFGISANAEYQGSYKALKQSVIQHSARLKGGYVFTSAGIGESTTDYVFTGHGIIAENGVLIAEGGRFSDCSELTIADIDAEAVDSLRLQGRKLQHFNNYEVISLPIFIPKSPLARQVESAPFIPKDEDECAEILTLQSRGLEKRLAATSCKKVVLGVSGGLDSTLALIVVAQAFDSLGLDRKGIIGVTMPGFGTTGRTYNNAMTLMQRLGITIREISIRSACEQHFKDIDLDPESRGAAYENSQARERTQILMDIANVVGGMVIGTGDLSESALGWATYNGDHMSMYNVNCSVPKTLVKALTAWAAENSTDTLVGDTLKDIVSTPVSPELLPATASGDIAQKTEDLVGPYSLHDFFIYNFIVNGFTPAKILFLATEAFDGEFTKSEIKHWLTVFIKRFFSQQYKRSAVPDGPKVTAVSLSPRGSWVMPSDAVAKEWLADIE